MTLEDLSMHLWPLFLLISLISLPTFVFVLWKTSVRAALGLLAFLIVNSFLY